MCVESLGPVQLFVTPWTIAHQAPLSMGLSRQGYWMCCHFLLQGIFLTQGWNPHLLLFLHWLFFLKPLSQILFSLKKEGSSDTGYNMDET